jgi:hypothetical protein
MANQQDFIVKNGMVVRNTATISNLDNFVGTSTDVIVGQPTLNLNFLTGRLDSRIAFTRASGATYVGPDGYIKTAASGQPRFEYSSTSTGTILGLLVEDQRTNSYTSSTDYYASLSNGYVFWDGSLGFRQNAPSAYSTTTIFTMSVYLKVNAYTSGQTILLDIGDGPSTANVSLSTFPAGAWTRFVGTGTLGPSGNFVDIRLQSLPASYTLGSTFSASAGGTCPMTRNYGISPDGQRTSTRILVLNTTTGAVISDMEVWGLQVESGQNATSLIITGNSSVTRSQEVVQIIGTNFFPWFNPTEGTFFAEFDTQWTGSSGQVNSSYGVLSIDDQNYSGVYTSFNGIGMYANSAVSTGNLRWATRNGMVNVNTGPVTLINPGTYITPGKIYKLAGAYASNAIALAGMGIQVSTATDYTSGIFVFNRMRIGQQNTGGNGPTTLHGHLRRIQYWPKRLTNTQMLALTSSTVYTGANFADLAPRSSYTANTSNFVVQQGVQIRQNLEVPDVDKYYVTNLTRPTQQPSLKLNFLTGKLDPRIKFSRASQATYIDASGFVDYASVDQPRFQYSTTSTGTCLGLLIESQRTNMYRWSTTITTSTWGTGAFYQTSSIQENAIKAPDGSYSAVLVSNIPNLNTAITPNRDNYTTATYWTRSVYAKYITGSPLFFIQSILVDNSYAVATFDIQAGTASAGYGSSTGNVSISNAGNGWWRCSFTVLTLSTGSVGLAIIGDSYFIGGYGSTATPTTFGLWGFQAEAGSFASSLIPTGSAAATRSGDTAYMFGQDFTSWNNPSQGTYFAEGLLSPNYPNFASVITTRDSPGNNYITLYQYIGQVGGTLRYGNNVQIGDPNSFGATNTGTFYRQALTYKSGSYYSTFNTATSTPITDARLPFNIDRMYIGGNQNGDGNYNSVMRRIVYYPTQLTTATMLALTSSTFI